MTMSDAKTVRAAAGAAPPPGGATEILPGIFWVRLPLPFRLDHVNVYLLEDADGWTVLDAGIGDAATLGIWCDLESGLLAGRPIRRVLVSHHHPDHIGAAGWLCRRHDAALLVSAGAYRSCLEILGLSRDYERAVYRSFYERHGLPPEIAYAAATAGRDYIHHVWPLPDDHRPVGDGEILTIGSRRYAVMNLAGHAPDQTALYCEEERLFFSFDHVLPEITPNISVFAEDDSSNPLQAYLASLARIRASVAPDVLVLPGHRLPFTGLHARIDEIVEHHRQRCAVVLSACTSHPRSVADLIPLMFRGELDAHHLGFAFSEALAHVNLMVERGELAWTGDDAPVALLRAGDAGPHPRQGRSS